MNPEPPNRNWFSAAVLVRRLEREADCAPLRVFRFSEPALSAGIEVAELDGVGVRVYGLAKTVADCFRFRNKIGAEVAVEALSEAVQQKGVTPAEVLRYARLLRVQSVVLPYLEALR